MHEDDGFLSVDALSFLNDNRLIGFEVRDYIFLAAGPGDLESQSRSFLGLTESERQWQL